MNTIEAALEPADEEGGFVIFSSSIDQACTEFIDGDEAEFFYKTGRHDPGFRTILKNRVEESLAVGRQQAETTAFDLCILYRALEIQRTTK